MKRSLRSGSRPETELKREPALPTQRHTKSLAEGPKVSLKGSGAGTHQKRRTKKGTRVRVWWPPTDERGRTGFSGMYWPALLVKYNGEDAANVEYDNGDTDTVDAENIQPCSPPCAFGEETQALQEGEFVEVSNNSKTDPAEWVGVVRNVKKKTFTISYPFHSAKDDQVREGLLRRARVWDSHLSEWLCLQPYQDWEPGEVTSPAELYHCTESELFACLAGDRKKIRVVGRRAAQAAAEIVASQEEDIHYSAKAPMAQDCEEDTGTTAIARDEEEEQGECAQEHAVARIPQEWLPAPNLGPDCYIVPSRNPNEEPYVVRVAELLQEAPLPATAPPLQQQQQQQQRQDVPASGSTAPKKRKDPLAPRKPLNPYHMFGARHREHVKQDLGPNANAIDVTRKIAQLWAQVDQAEKRALQDEFETDCAKYDEAMRSYDPTASQGGHETATRKRPKKDKDAPKNPRTAYMLFCMDYRKEADNSLNLTEATSMAAEAWKAITPSLKAQYEAMAAIEKQAYEEAKKVYLQHKLEQAAQNAARAPQDKGMQVPPVSDAHPKGPDLPEQDIRLSAAQHDIVAGYPTDTLERLNLDMAKQALKKEKLHPDAYYMLVDAWRHDSPRLEAALRAYRLHIDGQKRPDYKGFLVGIFGLETMRPLMMNNNNPPLPRPTNS